MARGGDIDEIARRHDVRPKTLIWWRSELTRRARESSSVGGRLLPVVIESPTAPLERGHAEPLEIAVQRGTTRVNVRGVMNAEHLAAAITAAMRSC